MTLEEFIREHMDGGKKDFVLHVDTDPTSKKITAKFADDQPDGGVAYCRIEGNVVTLHSHDTLIEKRTAAERLREDANKAKFVAEEKLKQAEAAEAAANAAV